MQYCNVATSQYCNIAILQTARVPFTPLEINHQMKFEHSNDGSEFATIMDRGADGAATSVLEQMRSELSGKDAELERRQKKLAQLESELSTKDKELKMRRKQVDTMFAENSALQRDLVSYRESRCWRCKLKWPSVSRFAHFSHGQVCATCCSNSCSDFAVDDEPAKLFFVGYMLVCLPIRFFD